MMEFNARDYNKKMVKGIFRNIYPVIAQHILERTGVRAGCCLDVGGGPGMLGIRLAEITDLDVTIYDREPECIDVANENIAEHGLTQRMRAVQGSAESIGFPEGSMDIVISRGSIFFWEDQARGVAEIYRVLKKGGWAYVGGGMGSAELLAEVDAARAKDASIHPFPCRKFPPGHFENLLTKLGIHGSVDSSPGGVWIVFQKG